MANDYWEYKLPAGFKRPLESGDDAAAWQFIKDKYVKRQYAPKNATDPAAEFAQGTASDGLPPPVVSHAESKSKPIVEELDIEATQPTVPKAVPQPANDVLNLLEPQKPGDLDFMLGGKSDAQAGSGSGSGSGPGMGMGMGMGMASVSGPGWKTSEETKRVRLPSSNSDKRKEDIFSVFGPSAEQPVELDKDRFKSCPATNKYAVFDQLFAPPASSFNPQGNGFALGPHQPWPASNPALYAAYKSNPAPYRAPPTVPKQPTTQFAKPATLAPPMSSFTNSQPTATKTKAKAFEDILPPDL
jgi:hypothetical protein